MSYFFFIVYFALFLFILKKSTFFQSDKVSFRWVVLLFASRFVGGVLLWALYAFVLGERATGDIFKYFDDGNIIFYALRENPADYFRMVTGIGGNAPHLMKYYDTCLFWVKDFNYGLINDNRILIRFNAIVRLFSLGNIHIHTLFMSFISFSGLWGIYKVFEKKINCHSILLILGIFFFPSVVFWMSGLLKEGILIFAFGMFFYQINKVLDNNISIKSSLIIAGCFFLLLLSKFYILIAALPGFLFLLFAKHLNIKALWVKFVLAHLIFLLFVWFSEPLIGISFPNIIANKQHDFINQTNAMQDVGSAIQINRLDSSFTNLVKNIPQALYNSSFRPTIFEIKNAQMFMAAAENTLILILIVLSIIFFRKKYTKEPLLWFCISYGTILFSLVGLTTPVLGALVRYKAPALPFLGVIFIFLIDFKRFLNWIKRKKQADF